MFDSWQIVSSSTATFEASKITRSGHIVDWKTLSIAWNTVEPSTSTHRILSVEMNPWIQLASNSRILLWRIVYLSNAAEQYDRTCWHLDLEREEMVLCSNHRQSMIFVCGTICIQWIAFFDHPIQVGIQMRCIEPNLLEFWLYIVFQAETFFQLEFLLISSKDEIPNPHLWEHDLFST